MHCRFAGDLREIRIPQVATNISKLYCETSLLRRKEQDVEKIDVAVNAFDSEAYLNQNPDVAASGIDPLHHYISF